MRETPKITLRDLRGACREQRAIFKKEWPDGAALTLKNARRAAKLNLHVWWIAHHLFNTQSLWHYWGAVGLNRGSMAEAELIVRIYRAQLKRSAR